MYLTRDDRRLLRADPERNDRWPPPPRLPRPSEHALALALSLRHKGRHHRLSPRQRKTLEKHNFLEERK